MVSSLRATCFEAAVRVVKLAGDSSIRTLVSIPAGQQITDERPKPDANSDGLVRVFMDRFIDGFSALDRLFADAPIDFFAPLQSEREAAAGFLHFFPGRVGRGVDQGLRVFGQLVDFITHGLFSPYSFFVVCLFGSKMIDRLVIARNGSHSAPSHLIVLNPVLCLRQERA
jgi:hypothetical protein